VRAPNTAEADFFKLPPDGRGPMYEVFRTAFDEADVPMRLTITIYPADHNQFVVNIGSVPEVSFQQESRETDRTLLGPFESIATRYLLEFH
jgi:GntR family transcriptional regulator